MTKKTVYLAERLNLTALHDDRIKWSFGQDRRFVCCNESPAARNHFLCQFSKVICTGVENLGSPASLRESLSSKVMHIVLDSTESVLDSQRPNAREIHVDVDELIQFGNLCTSITSLTVN